MSKLIILIGLPGSGKTTYLNKLMDDGEIEVFYDDYGAGSIEKDPNPRLSLHYASLVRDLRVDKKVAIADIRYCSQRELNYLLTAVIEAVPDTVFDLRYFENNPNQCKANVIKRNRPRSGAHVFKLIA